MHNMDNKYRKGKIYKLVNTVDDAIYIGSTCQKLCNRMCGHKTCARNKPNQPVYKHLNSVGWQHVHMVRIEKFPCNSLSELKTRERYWIELLKPQLNSAMPMRTKEECKKIWIENNKEKCKEQHRKRHAKYYQQRPEVIIRRNKEYYQRNKNTILAKAAEKIVCECGCAVARRDISSHRKTAKHAKRLQAYAQV